MEDHENDRDDIFFENRSQLTVAERDCLHHLESEEDRIERLQIQREAVLEKLWFTFQSAAASLAQLYKDPPSCQCQRSTCHNNRTWPQFQSAANKVTCLYRDSTDGIRHSYEHGYHAGYHKRTKDLASWARKKRKHIRREDLLAHLSGRSPPRRKTASTHDSRAISLSPKPASVSDELANFNLNMSDNEIDFAAALSEGRNPFSEVRKRQCSDIVMEHSPCKRSKFM